MLATEEIESEEDGAAGEEDKEDDEDAFEEEEEGDFRGRRKGEEIDNEAKKVEAAEIVVEPGVVEGEEVLTTSQNEIRPFQS